tara:strand:+ start:71 stop:304 length:234 start_codon:yes stop_codon:yes gene_type:complete
MAITREVSLQRIEVQIREGDDAIMISLEDSWDDVEDASLPLVTGRIVHLTKFDQEGELTDVSGYPALVGAVAAVVWA